MKRLLALSALVWVYSLPAAAQDAVQMYECVAQVRVSGHEQPSLASPPMRMPGGEDLRFLEKGDPGYAGVEKGKPLPEWLELYGALRGHGSSFLGFYPSKEFECAPVEG